MRQGPHVDWIYPLGGRAGSQIQCAVGLRKTGQVAEPPQVAVALSPNSAQDGHQFRPLTIDSQQTQPVLLEIGSLPELLEADGNDVLASSSPVTEPMVLNGRIETPGDVDEWPVQLTAGQSVELRLRAGRLGSPLMPQLELVDENGVIVAPTDDNPIASNTPSADIGLTFTSEQDRVCRVRIRDQFATRGGPGFAYRLQVGEVEPGFHLRLQKDAVTAMRGKEVTLNVRVERYGGLTGPVTLDVSGLPAGTDVEGLVIPEDSEEVALKLKPSETAPIGGHRLQIHGVCQHGDRSIRRTAVCPLADSGEVVDTVLFGAGIPTPFRFKNRGPYYAFVHAGCVYRHPFAVERNGYEGPIEVRVADRQRRHLQGVRGPEQFIVPAGTDEFEFPFVLAPKMSRDRLGRCLVMGVGEVTDEQGNRHQVVFTDGEESQAPISVKAPRLSVVCRDTSVYVRARSAATLSIDVQRDDQLRLPTVVELVVPDHIQGVTSTPVTLAGDQDHGVLGLQLASTAGPFNCPLTVRATLLENGDPVVAETQVTIVSE